MGIEYGKTDLAGIKINHAASKFSTGKQEILVLKDQELLKDRDTINEEEDALVSKNLVDQERLERNKARKSGNILGNDEFGDAINDMLPQYNEEKGVGSRHFRLADT